MILLKVPLRPISVNKMYRVSKYHCVYKSKEAREFEKKCKEFLKEQYKEPVLECEIAITIKFMLKGNKPIDLDNMFKLCSDCLQDIVIKNDHQIASITAVRVMNQEEDRIILSIDELKY